RHDAVTGWRTRLAGGSPEVRRFVRAREDQWRWWQGEGQGPRGEGLAGIGRPAAAVAVLSAGTAFEAGAPSRGTSVRLRRWRHNSSHGLPLEPVTELVDLTINGQRVAPRRITAPNDDGELADEYFTAELPTGAGRVEIAAKMRFVETGRLTTVSSVWTEQTR
ncbi:MAG: hypothetical protein ACRD2X_09580, partial [Vicinamibacteraceae bacterium]